MANAREWGGEAGKKKIAAGGRGQSQAATPKTNRDECIETCTERKNERERARYAHQRDKKDTERESCRQIEAL